MSKLEYVSYSEMKDLPLDQLVWACRVNALYMVAKAGRGHLGTSLSSMEAILAARRQMGENDVFIGSKAHDAVAQYAVLQALGTLDMERTIHSFRSAGGLPGHPELGIPGIFANCGSLGQGISKSVGFARSGKGVVYCLLGDGEMMEGQNWEAALFAKKKQVENIIAIVDCNGLSQDAAAFLSIEDIFKMFRGAGWTTLIVKNGNSYQDVEQSLIWARKNTDKGPTAILLKTVKGYGISEFAGQYWSHFGPPEDYAGALLEMKSHLSPELKYTRGPEYVYSVPQPHQLYKAFGEAVREAMEQDDKIVLLTADTARDLFVYDLGKEFPGRVIDCGVAEQNMVSMASALALDGYKPIVATYARFLGRAAEQVYNQITEGTQVVYVGSLAGPLSENGPGISHQCLWDEDPISYLMPTVEPNNPFAVGVALQRALGGGISSYIRLRQQI